LREFQALRSKHWKLITLKMAHNPLWRGFNKGKSVKSELKEALLEKLN
jgi:hypothetical protein